MLAKLIQASDAQALAGEWIPAQLLDQRASHAHPANPGAPTEAEARSEVSALKAELESAHASAERRVHEALATARRDAEQSARQELQHQVEAELEKLRHMTREILSNGARLRRQSEEGLVRLSVGIARRILHRELSIDPDALTGLVKAAFQRLDQREIHELRTDPAGAPVVRRVAEGLGLAQQLKIVADPALRPGSLVIDTTHGHLDASIESQLNEIERGFVDIVHHS